jgi:hypothetical protein
VLKPGYGVYILVGKPGAGKTTAALHIVAHDLLRRGVVSNYREALRETGKRLFLGRDQEELFEYIRQHVDSPKADWLIIDDAAVGFHDMEDPFVWAKFMDIIKTARNAITLYGIIFTTISVRFLSFRILQAAHVYYVKRDSLYVETYNTGRGCRIEVSGRPSQYVAIVEVEKTLVGNIHFAHWSRAEWDTRWRLAGAIPVSPEFAMPAEVEEAHIRARRERVRRAAEEALERIRRRRASDVANT